jgi:hypothetical protein
MASLCGMGHHPLPRALHGLVAWQLEVYQGKPEAPPYIRSLSPIVSVHGSASSGLAFSDKVH